MKLALDLSLVARRNPPGGGPPPPLVTAIAVGVLLTRPLNIAGLSFDDDILTIL